MAREVRSYDDFDLDFNHSSISVTQNDTVERWLHVLAVLRA